MGEEIAAGPDAVDRRSDPTSDAVLDAALELVAASGARKVTMDEVAARAGVGRMTVYRRFGERARLIEALFLRETQRALARVQAATEAAEGPHERFAEGFAAAIGIARTHPLVLRMTRVEPERLLRRINDPDEPVFALMRAFLAETVLEGQREGDLSGVDPEAAAELLFRVGISFLLVPSSSIDLDDPEAARELGRSLIAPMLATGAALSSVA